MKKPFAGIRILDFTRYVAGPFGTYQLALLGAEVIKIEPKSGDEMRHSQLSREWAERGLGPSFLGINSNKRSLTLDLSKPAAIEIVKRLAADTDVVWENFRPGVMDRLGIGYEALRSINPRLVYCAVSGFGQNGPERSTAAFDGKLQAMSGIMSITGHEEMGPTRGRPEALEDPRYADWPARNRNEKALRAMIEEALAAADAKSWEKRLTAADVPCAAIWPISEIVHHPQLEHRDVLQQIDSAEGRLTLVGSGFRLNEGGGSIESPPPHLGEHNAKILAQAGYSEAEIAAFREEGVT